VLPGRRDTGNNNDLLRMWRVTVGPMLLQPGNSDVFKKYSQMKRAMKRESLHQPTRKTNEMPVDPLQTTPEICGLVTLLGQ
jgi:hypothetical protein